MSPEDDLTGMERIDRTHLMAEALALNPVHHVASVACPGNDCVVCVDSGHLPEVLQEVDEIIVGATTPIVPNGYCSLVLWSELLQIDPMEHNLQDANSSPNPVLPLIFGSTTT